VVTLHCPQTAENTRFVNLDRIGRMKKEAFFINAARGGLVNEHDLAAALGSGRIAGAALDVVSVEPIREDNPLLGAPNCILTPHMAWASLAGRRRLMEATAENIDAFLRGVPINVVN
jgi:glycerate dehydrogenase